MSEMPESIQNTLDAVTERVRNPFLFSFLTALVVNNYRAGMVLLSGDRYEVKFKYIDEIYTTRWDVWWHFLLIPFAVGMVYSLGFPWLDLGISAAREWIANKREHCILWLNKQKPIAEDHLAGFHAQYAEIKESLTADMKRQRQTFLSTNAELNAKKTDLEKRVRRLALEIAFTNVPTDALTVGRLSGDDTRVNDNARYMIRQSPHYNLLVHALEVIKQATPDLSGTRVILRSTFMTMATGSASKIATLIEMLLALRVISEGTTGDTFTATQAEYSRLHSLLKS